MFSTPMASAIENLIYLVFRHISMTYFNNFSMKVPPTAMIKPPEQMIKPPWKNLGCQKKISRTSVFYYHSEKGRKKKFDRNKWNCKRMLQAMTIEKQFASHSYQVAWVSGFFLQYKLLLVDVAVLGSQPHAQLCQKSWQYLFVTDRADDHLKRK